MPLIASPPAPRSTFRRVTNAKTSSFAAMRGPGHPSRRSVDPPHLLVFRGARSLDGPTLGALESDVQRRRDSENADFAIQHGLKVAGAPNGLGRGRL
jgi:hypothetical protein